MPETNDKPIKPKNWLESLNCAFEGVVYAFKTQRHIRYHYAIAAAALFLTLILKLSFIEFILFAIAIIMLLFAEMFNTALEETVNLLEEKHHITAKNAKDVSAGAVLISSMAVFIMGYFIFSKYLYASTEDVLRDAREFSGHIAIISILIVLIGVVFLKGFLGKGRPLHGGMPSGHSAIAFSIWASVALLTLNPIVTALTFIMAIMVSLSRLINDIHTKLEVFLGALFGSGMTMLIYYIFTKLIR